MLCFNGFALRRATEGDLQALLDLHAMAVHSQAIGYYTSHQIETYLRNIGTIDTAIIAAGTYFVVLSGEELVGSGGWSPTGSCLGTADSPLTDNVSTPAVAAMRAYFVNPRHARRGIARTLLDHAETDARQAGFAAFELQATLNAVPFYVRHGYQPIEAVNLDVGDCPPVPSIKMRKVSGAVH